jgi:hypothetical protein
VGFEPTIRASGRAKTVYALDRSATVTGLHVYIHLLKLLQCQFSMLPVNGMLFLSSKSLNFLKFHKTADSAVFYQVVRCGRFVAVVCAYSLTAWFGLLCVCVRACRLWVTNNLYIEQTNFNPPLTVLMEIPKTISDHSVAKMSAVHQILRRLTLLTSGSIHSSYLVHVPHSFCNLHVDFTPLIQFPAKFSASEDWWENEHSIW